MLDQETKRKINNARDVLVGKVPDPKAQVEQITTALIYKFMDDMDREAEELGGKPSFFTDGFTQYSWGKLMDKKLSGQERLNLYVEAITKMSQNPHIPQLFRNIFKDAFLPYRAPETLHLFLKEINDFTYDHSENLGNAFEYLLLIMGSQGDAGQFRTPRHIIDFIVEVVDPQKDETILDPACGTAGFLISAYKHIIADHDCKDNITGKPTNEEKPLTPDEKKKMMNNFTGYDISPDMVRLSLVNMYLHGFSEPKVYEYDTLSSEDKWDEMYDVIMANPPFMTPKGGIRPHKRFSVQANRSEVLFVDYILEHLNQKGRAGIIVPEGIIFQSANAYKKLRQFLIEDGLFAVVSLPAGVFNPYSGVKTSILFFDNQIAKLTKDILFVKITDDGFDLGAQRRKLDTDGELPIALQILKTYREGFEKGIGKKFKIDKSLDYLAWLVSKKKIEENGDYNLSGDRYKEIEVYKNQKWEMVELKKIADIEAGNSAPQDKELFKDGKYPFFRTSDVGLVHISDNLMDSRDKLNEAGIKGLRLFPKNTILFPKSGASTFLNHRAMLGIDGYVSSHLATIMPNENKILPKFLFNLLKNIDAKNLTNDQNYPSLKTSEIAKIKIPLPSVEVQKEMVEQIEVKQNAIDAAKAVIENLEKERHYFGQSLRKLEGIKWVELDDLLENVKYTNKIQKSEFKQFGKFPIVDQSQNFIAGYWNEEKDVFSIKKPVVIFGDHTRAIKYVDFDFVLGADGVKILQPNNKIISKFLYFILLCAKIKNLGYSRHFKELARIKIPLISIEIQKQLVAEAENLEDEIERNKNLVHRLEKRILWKICQIMQNLPHFNKLFFTKDFIDNFGWSPKWNEEVEKWLAFIYEKDNSHYKNNENRTQSDKQRDELLGEYKAAYFIEKKCGGKIVEFEPNGQDDKKLDFCFKDKSGVEWFAEVKSPSWRNEISKKIDDDCLRNLRGRMIITNCKNWPKCTSEMNCPLCNKKIIFEIDDTSEYEINQRIKNLACDDCKKHIWNALEPEREKKRRARFSQPQFINGQAGLFSSTDAIEDAIRNSVEQFEQGKNNLLIITPNMIAGPNYGALAASCYEKHKVQEILKKYDANKIISAILILEISSPAFSKKFDYEKNIILIKGKVPVL